MLGPVFQRVTIVTLQDLFAMISSSATLEGAATTAKLRTLRVPMNEWTSFAR